MRPVVWFEVMGSDGEALQRFYSEAFGWQFDDVGGGYGVLREPERGIGGGIGSAQGQGHVTFYVEVEDPQAEGTKLIRA